MNCTLCLYELFVFYVYMNCLYSMCRCPPGYYGEKCEMTNNTYCDNYCENGGKCVLNALGPKCQCPDEYKGMGYLVT